VRPVYSRYRAAPAIVGGCTNQRCNHDLLGTGPDSAGIRRPLLPARHPAADDQLHPPDHRSQPGTPGTGAAKHTTQSGTGRNGLVPDIFIMGPTVEKIYQDAYKPYSEQKLGFEDAVTRGAEPLRAFMLKQTRQADLELFTRIAGTPPVAAAQTPLRILVPAFATSELKTAFQTGFMVFIPFLVVDLIVASVLTSMGMMMLSPVLVALPIKLMLFVLADGWNLLMGSLVAGFGMGT